MKAVAVASDGTAKLVLDYPEPKPKDGEALIRVIMAGICSTDLEVLKGYMGFTGVLGHEFVGEIVQVDPSTGLQVNQRVAGEINLCCDQCNVCQAGGVARRNHCPQRTVMGILNKDGTFAEYITLPVANLYLIPDNISDDCAVFIEPLAAAFRIVEQIEFQPHMSIAVIGDGRLGNLIAQVLAQQPHSSLTVFGKYQNKLDKIPQGHINKVIVDSSDVSGDHTGKFDVCVEACGHPSGLMTAVNILKPLGTLVLKTTCAATDKGMNTAPIVINEIKVLGSRCGNFGMAIKALKEGSIKVEHLIDKKVALDQYQEGLDFAKTKGVMKVIIQP